MRRLRSPLGAATLAALLSTLAVGCGEENSQPRSSLTSGKIIVAVESPVSSAVREIAREFRQHYPDAQIIVEERTVREAMSALYGARVQAAVIGRELVDEEREAARSAGIGLTAHRWARDGIAVVVHPDNPVEQVAFDDLREIFAGKMISWDAIGGASNRITPVIPEPETGLFQSFADRVLAGEEMVGPAVIAPSDSAVAARVARDPTALGIVSLPFADQGVKALRISRLKGLPYIDLDARTVYEDRYPLTRFYNIVVREDGPRLADSFVTYMCGGDGQKWVRDEGFVPATVPVKFTVRTPTVSAHGGENVEE